MITIRFIRNGSRRDRYARYCRRLAVVRPGVHPPPYAVWLRDVSDEPPHDWRSGHPSGYE